MFVACSDLKAINPARTREELVDLLILCLKLCNGTVLAI